MQRFLRGLLVPAAFGLTLLLDSRAVSVAAPRQPAESGHPSGTAAAASTGREAAGGFHLDIYRGTAYVAQKTGYWCVGASIQIMDNLIDHGHDHSYRTQRAMMAYARNHDLESNRRTLGSDPLGWARAVNRFSRANHYTVHAAPTRLRALRSAVMRIRRTHRPVGIAVWGGSHAWVISGFRTDVDPLRDRRFRILRVYVTGPLWPNGDLRPDTGLTPDRLRAYYTPFFPRHRGDWNGRFVTVQPR